MAIILADRVHDLYNDFIDLWELYRNAVSGGPDFINDDQLFSHRLEDSEDYSERLDRAYYLNMCETVPQIYNAYINSSTVERPSDDNLSQFRENIDRQGTKISKFISQVGFWAKVFGVTHALVDMPVIKSTVKTARDVKEQDIYPYATIIFPSQIKDWSLDRYGNLNWIVIESTYYKDLDPTKEREVETHYKLITREEWRVENEDGASVSYEDGHPNQGKNELGIVPLVSLYHDVGTTKMIGKSLLRDIVYINRIIMNWCSCLDEQIERQTFSQLVVPDDGSLAENRESGGDPLHKIGTSSIWTFNSLSTHPPAFISPNTENLVVIWNLVLDHIKEIFRLSGLIGSSDDMYTAKSGRAAQMGFLGVNSALAETSKKYQEFENTISKLSYLYLGKNPSEYSEVKYPETFDITSLENEINAYFQLMSKNFSVRLNKIIAKDLARRATPLTSNDTRKEIETEIEAWDGIIEKPDFLGQDGKDGDPKSKEDEDKDRGDGNPNSNIGKTFRTSKQNDKENRPSKGGRNRK